MTKCVLPIQNNRTHTGAVPLFTEGLYELAGRIYSWMIPNGSWGESNHGLITGRTQSILVDTAGEINYLLIKKLLHQQQHNKSCITLNLKCCNLLKRHPLLHNIFLFRAANTLASGLPIC